MRLMFNVLVCCIFFLTTLPSYSSDPITDCEEYNLEALKKHDIKRLFKFRSELAKRTLLLYVLRTNKQLDLLIYLLDTVQLDIFERDRDNDTLLHCAITINNPASDETNIQIIEELIQRGVGVNHRNFHGASAIYLALETSRMDVFEFLRDNGSDFLSNPAQGYSGQSLIQLAARMGNLTLFNGLLTIYNEDPTVYEIDNEDSAFYDELSCTELHLNHTDNIGNNLMHYAAWGGNIEIIRRVHKLRPEQISAYNFWGESTLISALESLRSRESLVSTEAIEFLIDNGVDLEHRDGSGRTFAYYAVYNMAIMENQLRRVDSSSSLNRDNNVINQKFEAILNTLNSYSPLLGDIHQEQEPNEEPNEEPDEEIYSKNGMSLLQIAALTGSITMFNYLLTLGDKDSQLNHIDSNGNTILHYAVWGRDLEMVRTVYNLRPHLINTKNNWDITPLYATEKNPFECTEKVLALQKKVFKFIWNILSQKNGNYSATSD